MSWTGFQFFFWNVTDQELIKSAAYNLLENNGDATTTYVTSMFSAAEMVSALKLRQEQFMRETGLVAVRVFRATTAGISRYSLPSDLIDIRRLAWQPLAGSITPLLRSDAWELDHAMLDWQYNQADPTVYHESTMPTLTVEIAKAPSQVGTLWLLYVKLGQALDGTGVKLSVPDEFAPFIKFGAIADLLSADGEGSDQARADWCEQFYQIGAELAKLLLRGSVTSNAQ